MSDVKAKAKARGIRNNNPGNIRHAGTLWQGQSKAQSDKAFITFNTPEMGIRAMARILLNYQIHHKLDTVDGIIHRWAPPKDHNDTPAYVNAVAIGVGVKPNDHIDLKGNPVVLNKLVNAIITHENGSNPYSPTVISAGVNLAAGDHSQPHRDRSHAHRLHAHAAHSQSTP